MKKIIIFTVFLSLLICNQGYCLFRDDIGGQQVQSAIKIQRAKDEQRKKQYEQVKQEEAVNEDNPSDGMTYSSQNTEGKSAKKQNFVQTIELEENKPIVQYKRHTREGLIVDTTPPAIVSANTVAKKKEEKNSNNGIVFLLLILGVVGFIVFKQKQNK